MHSVNSIPKIIHYCWFGNNQMSSLAIQCINSWKKYLPDYTFMKWDESKIDIHDNEYISEAYKNKKFSFVADYTRVYALYNYGGIYLDLDVEVRQSFNKFLNNKMFFSFEDNHHVSTAIIGCQKGHFFLKEILDYYKQARFSLKTNVDLITQKLCQYGLKENNCYQKICQEGITVYPSDYFSPLKFGEEKPIITHNTVCIHLFEGTWQDQAIKRKLKIINVIKSILGENLYYLILRRIKGLDYTPIVVGTVSTVPTENESILDDIDFLKYYKRESVIAPTGKRISLLFSNLSFIANVFVKKIDYLIIFENINVSLLKMINMIGIPVIKIIKEQNNTYSYFLFKEGEHNEDE